MLEGGGGGLSGYTIYQQVHPDAQFSQAMSEGSSTVKGTRQAHQDAAVELASIIESLDGSWRGKAAKAATGEFDALRKASEVVAVRNYEPADSGLDSQSGTHSGTRNNLEPMEPSAQEASWFGEALGYESQEEYDAQWQRQNRHNIEVYNKYEATTQSNVKPLTTEFAEIPKATEADPRDNPREPGNKPGSTTGTSSWTGGSGYRSGGTGGSSTGGTGGSSSGGSGSGGVASGGSEGASTGGVRTLPDGTRVLPDGTRILPDGTRILPDGTKVLPDGTRILPNGRVIPPGNTSAAGLADGSPSSFGPGLGTGGGSGASSGFGPGAGGGGAGGGGAVGFGPGTGGVGGGAGVPGALGAGKGAGAMPGSGMPGAGGPAAAAKGAGGMGRGMGGMMGGGAGAGRGQGGEETEHQDQYYVKQELDPGLHVEYDEFGEKLIDHQTGLTVVPPVIGE